MSFSASFPVVMTLNPSTPSNSKRRSAKFSPSIWQDTFLKYADSESLEVHDDNIKQQAQNIREKIKKKVAAFTSMPYTSVNGKKNITFQQVFINETMKQEVQMDKEKVKRHLSLNDNNILQILSLIDSIQRLSIAYHFEREIDETLAQIHNIFFSNGLATEELDLRFTSLLFRLLRQNGYYISSDIFNKFKNEKGEFRETIADDVEGTWNLYEAAQLRIHGEDILEEAHEFTYNKLKLIINQLSPSLADQINQSLIIPLHKAIPRMRARSYMSFYEEDPSHDKALLNFAKLDFNTLQKWHKKEVGSATQWWRKSELATKVPYVRDRIAELYFCPYTMNSEPKYSTFRGVLSKMSQCLTVVDDTYDVYGTIEELELFTQAIQRWDISYITTLPECFKVLFNTIVELCDEITELTAVSGESNLVSQCLKQALSDYIQAYLVEAKWCHENYIPTYDDYKVVGAGTSGFLTLVLIFIASGGFATKDTLHWISNNNVPVIVNAMSLVGRLRNDLSTHKFEQKRKHVVSAVGCCIKQYGFSREEAYEFIMKDIENYWKDMNEEYLKLIKNIPRPVLECILNLARFCEFLYTNFEDKLTNCALFEEQIAALLVDPVVI